MAKVEITRSLFEEIKKKFKEETHDILDLIEALEENPHKGKPISQVGGIVIKEIKYGAYRFYFITDGFKIKMLQKEELEDLLIKFVGMSDKKNQQKVIDEIKYVLRKFGGEHTMTSHKAWLDKGKRVGKPYNDTPMRLFNDKDKKFLERWDLLGL